MSKYIGDVSAYAYAVSKGYAGTEEEFAELMADYAEVGQRAEDAADRAEAALDEFTSVTADATTLPEGSSATAEYSDGHLTLGIPKGDKGDGAYHVELSGESFVIHTDASGVAAAQEFMIYIDARQGTTKKVISRVEGLPSISTGSGTIAPEIIKHAFTGSVATIIYTIPANTQISAGQINAQYTAYINDGTANGFGVRCALSVAVVKDGAKGDKGDTGDKGDKGDKGDTGNTGNTPNLTIGTVTTLQPTAPATATITGTADNPVLSFGIPKGDTGEVSQEQFDEALALKADAIGNYPELAVGTAEQIDSDTVVSEDNAPYFIRKSIADGSNRLYDQIVGGTLSVNQLVRDPLFEEYSTGKWGKAGIDTFSVSNGVLSITPNGSPSRIGALYGVNKKGHKYFMSAFYNGTEGDAVLGWYGAGIKTTPLIGRWQYVAVVFNSTYNDNDNWQYDFQVGNNQNFASYQIMYPKVCDLTAMFGTTIADYIYSLETATAGAGVAWLKARFPKIFDSGYIPYNAGTLEHVSGVSAHKMTGFNQWDEEWEVGSIDITTGKNTINSATLRAKNYTQIVPSTQYYFLLPWAYVFWYDVNKNYISYSGNVVAEDGNVHGKLLISPENAYYCRFRCSGTYGTTYKNDICINISSSRNGEYEPYEEHSYPLDDSLELRGLPKLDADNNLVYDGDVYESTGNVTRKYGIVDLGTLTYIYETSTPYIHFMVSPQSFINKPKFHAELLSTIYVGTKKTYQNINNMEMCIDNSADTPVFRIRNDAYTSASDFKAAMSGVMLVYELATPTTETAQPFTNPQVVDASGTEEYVTDSVVPVGHVTKYVENLKAKLESAPASPAEDGDYIVRQTDGVNEYVPLGDVTDLLKAFPVDTASGSIASFTDGAELPLKSLTVDIEPIQDLHGYDNPWPAGGGKNKLPMTVDSIKAANTKGTWTGNSYVNNGITYTLVTDNDGNIIKIHAEGTRTGSTYLDLAKINSIPYGTYIINGGATGVAVRAYHFNGTNIASSAGTDAQFTSTEDAGNNTFDIVVFAESEVNVDVFPMVRLATESDVTFAPYSNICPISGHTQAVVTRTGVNVWDEEWENGRFDIATGNKISGNGLRTKNLIPVIPNTTYFFTRGDYTGAGSFVILYYDANKSYLSYDNKFGTTTTVTMPVNAYYINVNIQTTESVTTYNNDISINYPSTDHDYHPYSGQSITIDLGQTVYGGKLDVLSGELVIDRAIVDLGTLNWAGNGNDSVYTPMLTNKLIGGDNCVCSALAKVAQGTQVGSMSDATFKTYANSADVAVRLSGITNQNAQTMLSGFQFVYPLATPITITLTPNELSTLLGANNIWSDAGEVTAEYRADPTLFIQRKIAEALS